ncbi:SUKH-3 domain-containing protein [Paenibacillus macerans]|uniref:SUKH-3 domain-containing protein n=1 Tax=Paenibacillus macerans TaxID=44252 RepID=UPI00203C1F86|nr:SUKH-3 domain-containing protein [Paenibacillus macerans]MCM3700716.1 SUKH-3 domain-containing protein [Paenibacillus macerans]
MEDQVRDLLQNAGWFKGREESLSQYLDFLNDEEYCVFKSAADFLKEYGGLVIPFKNPKRLDRYFTLTIDPIDAASSVFREVSKRYERYCNEPFVIVGQIPLMDMTWYISSSGTFYGGNDDFLIRLGSNFFEALHNIVSGVQLEVIIVEED